VTISRCLSCSRNNKSVITAYSPLNWKSTVVFSNRTALLFPSNTNNWFEADSEVPGELSGFEFLGYGLPYRGRDLMPIQIIIDYIPTLWRYKRNSYDGIWRCIIQLISWLNSNQMRTFQPGQLLLTFRQERRVTGCAFQQFHQPPLIQHADNQEACNNFELLIFTSRLTRKILPDTSALPRRLEIAGITLFGCLPMFWPC